MAIRSSFGRDRQGAVAIEFAILAPVMIALMFGSFSVTHVVRASMNMWTASQALADLVAQQVTVTSAQMTDFCIGANLILAKAPGTLAATVASVTNNASGTRAVDWQDTSCGSGATMTNALTLGANYTPSALDSVIVVQSIYTYNFPPSYILPASITFSHYSYARPRNGTQVTHG